MASVTISDSNKLLKSLNSFSGTDIRATFGNKEIGELQAISWAIQREKAPIYTMGRADPRAFSRGKRGIAGSMIFIMFDKSAILYELAGIGTETGPKFSADTDEQTPSWSVTPTSVSATTVATAGTPDTSAATTSLAAGASLGFNQVAAKPWYADQIPPFDTTLVGANEYGAIAVARVIGIDLLNEGYGVSIDDIVSEMQYTYVARMIIPWTLAKQNDLAG